MNAQSVLDLLHRSSAAFSAPPPAFLSGMVCGLLLGMAITSAVLGRRTVSMWLRQSLLHSLALLPPVLACLLWGAWIGILAAKTGLH